MLTSTCSPFILRRVRTWKRRLPLLVGVVTTSVALRGVTLSANSAPPHAQIVYSLESAKGNQLYLDAWPEESKRAVQPKSISQYRPGNDARFPVFSPDGRSILFTGNRVSSGGKQTEAIDYIVGLDLWVLDIEKNSVRPLTTDGAGYLYAQWSPDGRYICAVSLEGYYSEHPIGGRINNLYVWDVQTGKRRLLAKNASNPKWSSDGKQVCYEGVTGDEVPAFLCVDRNGGKAKVLLLPRSTAYLGGWSPDGRFLAYSEYDSSQESYNVSILRRGERKPRRFLKLLHGAVELKWSPDGRKIALVENIPHQPGGEYKSRLLVLDVRSGQAKHLWSVLGEVTILRWSKHSDWVVASRYRTLAPGYQQELVATSVNDAKAVVLKAPTERANGFDWREVRKEPMTVFSSRPERVSVRRRRMATYPLTPLLVASSVCEYASTATQCDPLTPR